MKKIIILILAICAININSNCQINKDSVVKQVKNIETYVTVTDNQNGEKSIVIESEDAGNNLPAKYLKNHFKSNKHVNRHLSHLQKAFVLMPVILFAFMLLMIFFWLRRDNFKFSELFSSKFQESVIKTTVTKADTNDTSKSITEVREEPVFKRSSSRFIALLTVFTILIIVICLISYFIYFTISDYKPMPYISGLWKILAVLLIGIIPYSINRMFKK